MWYLTQDLHMKYMQPTSKYVLPLTYMSFFYSSCIINNKLLHLSCESKMFFCTLKA